MPSKHPMPLKTLPNLVCILCIMTMLLLFVCIYIIQWMEIIVICLLPGWLWLLVSWFVVYAHIVFLQSSSPVVFVFVQASKPGVCFLFLFVLHFCCVTQNFVYKRINRYFSLSSIFPLPTLHLTKDGRTGSTCFCQAELNLVLWPGVGPPLFSVISKGECLLSWI